MTIIWDGLPVHRSKLVREFVAGQRGMIQLEFLPAYAPELNPVEYIWGYCKQHELPNLCPKDFGQLSWAARKALGRMRRRPTLVESFWKQLKRAKPLMEAKIRGYLDGCGNNPGRRIEFDWEGERYSTVSDVLVVRHSSH